MYHNMLETFDFSPTAVFHCFHYRQEYIDNKKPTKTTFIFQRELRFDEVIVIYRSHSHSLDPMEFPLSFREPKIRFYLNKNIRSEDNLPVIDYDK
jgi:hypothetical protein